MFKAWMKFTLLTLVIGGPWQVRNARAVQCCGGTHGFELTVVFDGVTINNSGELKGTPTNLTPGEEVDVNYTLVENAGPYGENPAMICTLDGAVVFYDIVEQGGGAFSFYAPRVAGAHYFNCSLSGSGATPTVQLKVT